jgi:transposase
VAAATVDDAVADRLLAALDPEQVALALAAADELQARHTRTTRAAELAVERARYQAARAERAFHACEPDNRLVARSLERRWEAKLAALTDAEQGLTTATQALVPLPPRPELEALVADLPGLWAAPSTTPRDRKRLLRTLVADVTLLPSDAPDKVRIGLRWQSGATEELQVARAGRAHEIRRTAPQTVALARELGPRMSNPELAAALNQAGHRTGAGRPFDTAAARNLRYAHRIGAPDLVTDGELTPRAVADRLEVSTSTVHAWLATGELVGRRNPAGRWCIPFPPDIEAACRARVAASAHVHPDADAHDRQPGELSIAEVASRLGVKPDVVYYWAQRGYLPTRRGKSGRRWVTFTPDTQLACHQRITNSYRLPQDVKSQAAQRTERAAV